MPKQGTRHFGYDQMGITDVYDGLNSPGMKKILLDTGFVLTVCTILLAVVIPVLLERGEVVLSDITPGGVLFLPSFLLGQCLNAFWIYVLYFHIKSGRGTSELVWLILLSVLYLPFYYRRNRAELIAFGSA